MLGISRESRAEADEGASEHRALVATTALLLEIALIDGSFTEDEKGRIVTILTAEYGLDEAEAEAVMDIARAQLKGSIDLWQFTSAINRHFSEEEKVKVVEMVWRVIFADGTLDKYEDFLVRTISNLLHLEHGQFIDAKLRARQAAPKR
ncbi:MAG TPA: TerB family tellurite resistance protein [Deltaproteobacteria bacterium]|nr:TerB family tellurite resistance protein [Deltaproteobacteria bacterium]